MTAADERVPDLVDEADDRRGGFGSLGSIVYLLVLTWAAGIASFPLNDNSFFTHLATGRIILDEGRVPSSDPYTFTAQGEPWTVQSWLASVAYAGSERLGGEIGLRTLVLLVFLVAATVLWRLSRPAESLVIRLLIMALALFVAAGLWTERPYMVGVIGLGLVWLALDGELRPWLLVPLLWVWANAHGSFPLALALVVAVIAGSMLDRRAHGEPWHVAGRERAVLGAVGLGTLLAVVGPLGLRVLTFPVVAAQRDDVFRQITEWQAPTFRSSSELAYLVFLTVTVVALVRRPSWRLALPTVLFAAAALYAQRNIVMSCVVLVAVCARCAPAVGSLTSVSRPRLGPALAATVAALALVMAAATAVAPTASTDDYPGAGLAWLDGQNGLQGRLVTDVLTGNLLEVLDGPTGAVFVDDRFDLLPDQVFEDYLVLNRGGSQWEDVLDRYDADVVVWSRSTPLASLLELSPDWRVVFSAEGSLVACARSACPA